MTVSLCMIVRDEEAVLGRCLDSIAGLFDEIIVTDTGSRDATKRIAADHGAHVFDFAWCDDFAAARNDSFSHATSDFLFWLDADDVLTEANREKFLLLKERLTPATDVVMMPYETAFDEDGKATFTFLRERLIRRTLPHRWEGYVHEVLTYAVSEEIADVAVTHKSVKTAYSDRNLHIYETHIKRGEPLSPRDLFYWGRELFYHRHDREASNVLTAFLHHPAAWSENKIDACRLLAAIALRADDREGAMAAYTRTFLYGSPRAEVCTEIGELLSGAEEWRGAIFWFRVALEAGGTGDSRGFRDETLSGFAPLLGLCVCYDRLGEREKAIYYNEEAAKLRPHAPAVLYNRQYFGEES
mgnify:CR=1 FL=1